MTDDEVAPVDADTIRDRLPEWVERDQWLMWDDSHDTPRRPHWRGDFYGISWNDPDDWHSFEEAVEAVQEKPTWGIGYVCALENDDYPDGEYAVIDIDGALREPRTETPKDWVPSLQVFVKDGAYIEYSPSGTGLHIPVKGHEAPEWWSDTQFSDDEHEGVEYLTNKFVTVTGMATESAGDRVTDADPSKLLTDAHEAITGEGVDTLDQFDGAAGTGTVADSDDNGRAAGPDGDVGGDYDGEEYLEAEDIEAALKALEQPLSYPEWRNVGFAVHDWDNGAEGKRLFREFSKQGAWDADSDDLIERIWSDSEAGGPGNVTLGTLIHKAERAGWPAPSPPSGRAEDMTPNTAAEQLERRLKQYTPDDGESLEDVEEPPQPRREEIGNLLGAITDEQYADLKEAVAAVLDTPPAALDEHRRLKQATLGGPAILTERGSTYYVTGTPTKKYEILNVELDVDSILDVPAEATQAILTLKRDAEQVETRVDPTVFNDITRFKDAVLGERFGMTFDPPRSVGAQTAIDALNQYLYAQDAPRRTGTRHMGLHGDEFVTPAASLTADGWTDDPEYVYLEQGLPVKETVSLSPDDGAEYDAENAGRIIRDLYRTRDVERFLPVLGWFYAAPFRPHIETETDSFNLLNVTGGTGSGKTTTLRYLWRCFGMDGEAFDPTDTAFTLLATLSATNSIPVWYDEYKPSDMGEYKTSVFHDKIRKTSTGGTAQRGNSDQSGNGYELNAPTVVSGEQQIQPSAERRRSIMVTFRDSVTEKGTETRRRFKDLTGEGVFEDGELVLGDDAPDPQDHALAYYQFVTAQDRDDVIDAWRTARETVNEISGGWEDPPDLDEMEVQGLETISFGWGMMRAFADSLGIDTTVLPDRADLDAALRCVADAVGPEGERKSHLDRFVELLDRAATADYLEQDEHYTFVHEGEPNEELRVNVPSAFDKVSKYVKDHDLDVDLLGPQDYSKRFTTAAEEDGRYVAVASQNSPPLPRAAGIETLPAMNALDFNRASFGAEPMDSGLSPSADDEGGDADAPPRVTAGGGTQTDPDAHPESAEYAAQRVTAILRDQPDGLSEAALLAELGSREDISPDAGKRGIKKAVHRGDIRHEGDDRLLG